MRTSTTLLTRTTPQLLTIPLPLCFAEPAVEFAPSVPSIATIVGVVWHDSITTATGLGFVLEAATGGSSFS